MIMNETGLETTPGRFDGVSLRSEYLVYGFVYRLAPPDRKRNVLQLVPDIGSLG